MYTCGVWVCMFHMYGWAYAHIWRSEVDVRHLPQSLSTSTHSGKVWLVLLAGLPQGFCLCLCYAGITGSAMTVKFLCGWNPNFDPYSALSAAVYPDQQLIYCFWSMLYHDSHTIPSKSVRPCIWPMIFTFLSLSGSAHSPSPQNDSLY